MSLCKKRCMINEEAPDFLGEVYFNNEFKEVSLHGYNDKWVILLFYPLNFTFVCPTELIEFSRRIDEFKELNTEIIGISCDSVYSHHAWSEMSLKKGGIGKLKYPLMSDLNGEISKLYNVLLENDNHPCRGTYIIDSNKKIRHISMNDPPVGRNSDEYIRLIKGYQFADEHGEVCPINWNPGSKTIKPEPTKKLEYFEENNKDELNEE